MPDSPNEIERPLVSVLVPAYNHEKYIESCLDSVAETEYRPIEVLVMDDGSDDRTYDRARAWMRKNSASVNRVSVARQSNQGINRTLNTLLSRAQGEYIAILASDDELLPHGISLRLSALEAHPEWLAVFADCTLMDLKGQEIAASAMRALNNSYFPALMNSRGIARELILSWLAPGPGMLLRRSAYENGVGVGRYDDSLQVEDRDFYLRLLAANALGFIPDRVARYRVDTQRISSRKIAILREGVASERKNISSFRGMNRWLLALVAYRNLAGLQALYEVELGHKWRGRAVYLCGKGLALVRRLAYQLHKLLQVAPPNRRK